MGGPLGKSYNCLNYNKVYLKQFVECCYQTTQSLLEIANLIVLGKYKLVYLKVNFGIYLFIKVIYEYFIIKNI